MCTIIKHGPNPSRGYLSIEVNRDENNNMNYMVFQENNIFNRWKLEESKSTGAL